ncbi:MAG: shikimate kinase [Chitinophagales bacterium]|nr:shikimate kinase [Chitinophagales bacterium]MDW8428749.1 shikimate kinase [Chitinophagales bacterium]
MGSGKTYLGRQLADLLKRPFTDLDQLIEQQEQCSIAELFAREGEQAFRQKEQAYLKKIPLRHQIIATGGGTPCFFDNLSWMNEHGLTVYLKVSLDILIKRLKAQTRHRPLLQGRTGLDLHRHICHLLQEREPFYQQARLIVEADQLTAEQLAQLLS